MFKQNFWMLRQMFEANIQRNLDTNCDDSKTNLQIYFTSYWIIDKNHRCCDIQVHNNSYWKTHKNNCRDDSEKNNSSDCEYLQKDYYWIKKCMLLIKSFVYQNYEILSIC